LRSKSLHSFTSFLVFGLPLVNPARHNIDCAKSLYSAISPDKNQIYLGSLFWKCKNTPNSYP
jgi:hypothetical protein